MRRLWIALGLAATLALAACGGEEEAATPSPATRSDGTPVTTPPARTPAPTPPGVGATPGAGGASVTVRALDFAFEPARINIQPSQSVTVTVRNDGQAPHTFTISELNVDVTVQPGQTMTVTFTPRAASHTFICRFHAGAGMTGTLTTGGGTGGGATTPPVGGSGGYGY